MDEEQYNPHGDSSRGGNFLYTSVPVLATNSSSPAGNFVIRPSSSSNGGSSSNNNNSNNNANFGNHPMAVVGNLAADCFQPSDQDYRLVKVEPAGSQSQRQQVHDFHYHLMREFQIGGGGGQPQKENDVVSMKARIVSHAQFSNLLQAFLDCQKVLFN